MAKKIVIGLLTMWGTLTGVNFLIANVALPARLIGLFAIVTSLLAVKKEFGGPRKLREN